MKTYSYMKIRKASTPRLIAEQLIDRIRSGELKPGESLPAQGELAKLFGVGRSSIREAINALLVMGHVEVVQGKGTFIQDQLPLNDTGLLKLDNALEAGGLLDLLEIRDTIECGSARLAAERASSENVRKLKKALRRMASKRGVYEEFLDADLQFHMGLAEATQNLTVSRVTAQLLEELAGYHRKLKTPLLSPEYINRSIHSARQILAAIESGDGSRAAEWTRTHLNEIRTELRDIIG